MEVNVGKAKGSQLTIVVFTEGKRDLSAMVERALNAPEDVTVVVVPSQPVEVIAATFKRTNRLHIRPSGMSVFRARASQLGSEVFFWVDGDLDAGKQLTKKDLTVKGTADSADGMVELFCAYVDVLRCGGSRLRRGGSRYEISHMISKT